ncbi:MAG: hypothetical protein WAN36_03160, partial [Calditrichia bacterium]
MFSFIDDLDNNYFSEIIYVEVNSDGKEFKYRIKVTASDNEYHIDSEPIWAELTDLTAYDVKSDGFKEILYTYIKNDSVFLKIYSPFKLPQELLNTKILEVKSRTGNKCWVGKLTIQGFADLNHDGHVEIIMESHAAYDLYPRGIIVYDIFNKMKMWEYLTGPFIQKVFIKDLNRDGHFEIYLQTSSPDNGASVNGTDDEHSCFLAMDENGRKLFQKELGGVSTSTSYIFNENTALDNDLYTVTRSFNYSPDSGNRIIHWSLKNWPDFYPIAENSSVILGSDISFTHKGAGFRIYAVNMSGEICVLDSSLNLLKTIQVNNRVSYFMNQLDLNHNGKKETIWHTKDGSCLILDNQFEPLAELPAVYNFFPVRAGRGKPPKYAALQMNDEFYQFSLVPVSFLQQAAGNKWIIIFLMLLFLNIFIWFILAKRIGNWKWYRQQLKYFEHSISALLILDSKGRVVATNRKLEHLIDRPSDNILKRPYREI